AAQLKTEAEWRPWVLDRQRWGRDPLALGTLQVYMRNRSFTGPEMARDDRAYQAARNIAIAALAPYYRDTFGRTAAAARHFAALYADRLVADGFEVDPDDSATLALFDPGYADEQKAERAALAGDTADLRTLLGDHPKDKAEMLKGQLDAPLVTDALPHPDTLKMLLALGLDPNARGPYGRTPLMVAARLDLITSARLLIAAGAGPDLGAGDAVAQTDRGGDPQCLGGSGGDTGDTGDTPGRTALSYAVEFASPAFVRLLIDHGASAGQRDSAGRRPADYLKRRQGKAATAATIAALLK
ncbi:MAG: ankyrin repeat domain-containing protein, partial [Stellaceae bacterium]